MWREKERLGGVIADQEAQLFKERDLNHEIKLAQLHIIYQHIPVILILQIPLSLVVLVIYWNSLSHELLFLWLFALWLIAAIRGLLYLQYIKDIQGYEKRATWSAVIGAACTGLLLGLLVLMVYYPGNTENAWVVIVIQIAAIGGSATLLSAYLPVFYAFFFSSAIPSFIALLLPWNHIYFVFTAASIVFVIYIWMVGKISHRAVTESLNLRFENLELIDALRERKAEAESANYSKSKFLAAASHDLRQPLHAISLFTGALGERIQEPEQVEIVAKLNASLQAMESLFNALLDISSLDSGELVKYPKLFPLQPILERIALENTPLAERKELSFRVVNTSLCLYTDPALLERILRNFVSNALRYTLKGGILLGCRRRGQYVQICVVDTGSGIPDVKQGEIFDEFVQLENPERDRSKGLGLGLAIVRRLAQLLDHRIIVHSIPGRGSLFAIEVPRAIEQNHFKEEAIMHESQRVSDDKKSIIIIDDDYLVLDALKLILTGWGHDILALDSGAAVRNSMANYDEIPHLIITDYRLPNSENGIDLIEYMRNEFNENIPAILITGDTALDDSVVGKTQGIRLMHKPVTTQKLKELLDMI